MLIGYSPIMTMMMKIKKKEKILTNSYPKKLFLILELLIMLVHHRKKLPMVIGISSNYLIMTNYQEICSCMEINNRQCQLVQSNNSKSTLINWAYNVYIRIIWRNKWEVLDWLQTDKMQLDSNNSCRISMTVEKGYTKLGYYQIRTFLKSSKHFNKNRTLSKFIQYLRAFRVRRVDQCLSTQHLSWIIQCIKGVLLETFRGMSKEMKSRFQMNRCCQWSRHNYKQRI